MTTPIQALIGRMESIQSDWAPNDARRFFHSVYARTTGAVDEEISRGGFLDGEWVERWDIAFADLYLDALAAWESGGAAATPGPWAVAFATARDKPRMPQLRHILFGMNVHINYDLPQALLAVISDQEFDDPALIQRRSRDHEHVDVILQARVAQEDELIGARSLLDRLLTPLNRMGTKRFLVEARQKVWRNTRALNRARRTDDGELKAQIEQLERLCQARVADLVAPGQVILKLAKRGFGVLLPDA